MLATLQGRHGMREVKVKRVELLAKVVENRAKHVKEYNEAVEGYKEAAIGKLNEVITELEERAEKVEQEDGPFRLDTIGFGSVVVPTSHEKDYNQVIEMLRMSVDDALTIKTDEFACYVMDDWDWSSEFKNVSQMYNKR